jgi:NADH-quinone oxidoreductase subunit N
VTINDLVALTPELIVTGAALLLLVLDLFLRPAQRHWLIWASLLGLLSALAANNLIPVQDHPTVQGMFASDALSRYFNDVVLVIALLSLLLSADYIRRQGLERGEYHALILTSTLGAMLMGSSANLLMVFLGIETLSIPLYVLAGFARGQRSSQEASLKYFLLGAFSSAVFLYGIALVYGASGTTSLSTLNQSLGAMAESPLLLGGVGLLLVGLGFKAAAVPFHTWAPDVYEGAPTSVTAFMAVMAKVGAFGALLRVFMLALSQSALPQLATDWGLLVGALAILTMILGNIAAVVQFNLKRLLAYSSIAHAGYLLVAVAASSIGGETANLAISGLLFYLLAYAFMTLGAFGVLLLLEGRGDNLSLSDLAGLANRQPLASAAVALFMISLAGLPPTAGFFAKFYVFSAVLSAGSLGLVLALIGVLTSVVSVYYYLRVIYYLYMRPAAAERARYASTGWAGVALVIIAIGVLVLGIMPAPLFDWASQAAVALLP